MVCLFYWYFLAVKFYTARMPLVACRQNLINKPYVMILSNGAKCQRFLVEEFTWRNVLEVIYMWLCGDCLLLEEKTARANVKLCDFGLLPWCQWDMHSYAMLRSLDS